MRGIIVRVWENRSYGFIFSEAVGKENIFFHKDNLIDCKISQLHERDEVEFEISKGRDGRQQAIEIRRLSSSAYPGVNLYARNAISEQNFSDDIRKIIDNLGKIFYVTRAGRIKISNSDYCYCLAKPTDTFVQSFHLQREIIVIFSDYPCYEPRDNDAYQSVQRRIGAQTRLEKAMHIIVHRDDDISGKMQAYLTDNTHKQIIIPFSFKECLSNTFDGFFVQKRFKEWLFDIDMFADVAPITNEVFFFGRRDFVNDIANKCKNGSNSGVFGLRRSGKTSVLFAVQRQLEAMGKPPYHYVYILCQNSMNWKEFLHYIMQQIFSEVLHKELTEREKEYNSDNTLTAFENDMTTVLSQIQNPLTLMFDEIENLTKFSSTDLKHRFDKNDFLFFWRAIKECYSKHQNKISILIAGTNPFINEAVTIGEYQNPMYATLAATNQGTYLQPLNFSEIKHMINTLGSYMGLQFADEVVGKLQDDCGGHPYLIRMTCSQINRFVKNNGLNRPMDITKAIYEKAIPDFESSPEAESFFKMILNILLTDYPTEYNTLKLLATEGDGRVSQIKTTQELHHLIGYGLVENNQQNYCIRYNIVNRYLNGQYKFQRTGLDIKEQKSEINLRLDGAEIELRKLVKRTLKSVKGVTEGKQAVIDAMEKNDAAKKMTNNAQNLNFDRELFDPSVNKGLFLSVLAQIIQDNADCFKNIFNNASSQEIHDHFIVLNKSRRCPSHSYPDDSAGWKYEDFEKFRTSVSWLEKILQENE